MLPQKSPLQSAGLITIPTLNLFRKIYLQHTWTHSAVEILLRRAAYMTTLEDKGSLLYIYFKHSFSLTYWVDTLIRLQNI